MRPGSGIKVKLDKERVLRFDMNAQVVFEDATGENTLDGEFWKKKMTAKTTRALIWACLVHEDRSLTLEQVGAFLTPQNSAKVSVALNRAMVMSAPELEEDAEEDDGKNVGLPTG
jgi:hypothetical protein